MRPFLTCALLAAGLAASAQNVPGWAAPSEPAAPPAQAAMDPPGLPNDGAAPNQVPLDGGLGLLALAGGAYAARRFRAARD